MPEPTILGITSGWAAAIFAGLSLFASVAAIWIAVKQGKHTADAAKITAEHAEESVRLVKEQVDLQRLRPYVLVQLDADLYATSPDGNFKPMHFSIRNVGTGPAAHIRIKPLDIAGMRLCTDPIDALLPGETQQCRHEPGDIRGFLMTAHDQRPGQDLLLPVAVHFESRDDQTSYLVTQQIHVTGDNIRNIRAKVLAESNRQILPRG